MILKSCLLLTFAYFNTLDAAFVSSFGKQCSIKDQECLAGFIQQVFKDIGENGIKDYDIPPIDPLVLRDIDTSLLNLVNISMVEGVVKGFKDTVVSRFDIQIENSMSVLDMVCNLNIKGKYKVTGSSPTLETLFGSNSIRGDGNFEFQLSNLQLTLFFHYHLEKNADDDVFFKFHRDEFHYEYTFGDAKLDADNILIGDNDASKAVVDIVNQNWPTFFKTYGGPFFDLAMNLTHDYLGRYSDKTPTRDYISDNLTSFAKNQ